ncbi:MAG TPA: hypothetical protein VGP81_11260 [Pyrinomonadaceae bacterium]|nr:hypothetical protein [Pyrinomonadaceae bacterium]
MKRTEIIIETQRVTVIQRRRQTIRAPDHPHSANLPVVNVIGNNRTSADEQFGNKKIQRQENEPCTDSRDR